MSPTVKVALVTGGGQGIGRAIAARLLSQGMKVVIAEFDEEAGEEAAADLARLGEVHFVPTDVAREADTVCAVAAARERFGGLDALVNNAAVRVWKPPTELSIEEWNHVIAVNLTGAFLCAKHAAPLLAARGGSIVNIASTRALMSEPGGESYGAAKGGLVALTHALAVSLGPGVRVNCISPGWIDVSAWKKQALRREPLLSDADHAQHPAGRVGRPEDVAALVAYLIGPEAGFVTGADFVLDGGMTRRMIYV